MVKKSFHISCCRHYYSGLFKRIPRFDTDLNSSSDIRRIMSDPILFLGQQTDILEIVAMVTGVIAVWLTAKNNIWCFPVGIINVCLYAFLFFSPAIRLYADGGLQLVYIVLLGYGWFNWKKINAISSKANITRLPLHSILKLSVITVFATLLLGYLLKNYTDASFPFIDSLLTSASLVAQWMIAKKYLENWIVWIIADIIYIPIYISKNLPLTAVLYFIFLGLAIVGFIDWRKNIRPYAA